MKLYKRLKATNFLKTFRKLYGTDEQTLEYQKRRYLDAVNKFIELYPERNNISIFSAPGRTEIGGNHTDHQHGCVLAAAVNLDIIAVVAFHTDGIIRVKSEGYDVFSVNLNDVSINSGKVGNRGYCKRYCGKIYGQWNRNRRLRPLLYF